MNDHNLDDLIIDTPHQKSSKAKSVLTIIALLIVVMIAAIVLTKIILKDPDAQPAVLVEEETEIVSPELTLQSATETHKANNEETPLSEMIEEEIEAPKAAKDVTEEEIKPETVAIQEKPKREEATHTQTPKAREIVKVPETITPTPKPKTVTKTKHKTTPKPVTKPKPAGKPKKTPKPATAKGTYYIQVGSFSKTPAPNSRLITAIRKQGFKHRIFTINGMKKVMVGPYSDRASADHAIVKVKDLINKSAFVVKR